MFARAEDKKLQSEIDFFMMFKHGRGRSREGCTFSTAITSRVFELHYTICCAFAAIDWFFLNVGTASAHVDANCCSSSSSSLLRKHSQGKQFQVSSFGRDVSVLGRRWAEIFALVTLQSWNIISHECYSRQYNWHSKWLSTHSMVVLIALYEWPKMAHGWLCGIGCWKVNETGKLFCSIFVM